MTWQEIHEQERKKTYYCDMYDFIKKEYENGPCFPPFGSIMTAFNMTPFDSVKCVILGQDPYPGPGQAMGMSFSVPDGISLPPSLRNIYREIQDEFGFQMPQAGNLSYWARQGVLLLNTILTVKAHNPGSHAGCGWETYTDTMIRTLNQKPDPVVYMLWGAKARAKKSLVTNKGHLVLEAAHPSPYSADKGFFGCGHFKKCNEFLAQNNMVPIDWHIPG